MGKYTKQVYFCDECKKEFDEDVLKKCTFCGKEVCPDCQDTFSLGLGKNGKALKEEKLAACKDCANTKQKKIFDKLFDDIKSQNDPKNLEFSD